MKKLLLLLAYISFASLLPIAALAASPLETQECTDILYIPTNPVERELLPVPQTDAINAVIKKINAVPVNKEDISLDALRKIFLADHIDFLQKTRSNPSITNYNYTNTLAAYPKYALKKFAPQEKTEIDFLFALALSHSEREADLKTAFKLLESNQNTIENTTFKSAHKLVYNELAYKLNKPPQPWEKSETIGNLELLIRWQTAHTSALKKDWNNAEKAYFELGSLITPISYTSAMMETYTTQWLEAGLHNDGWILREPYIFENAKDQRTKTYQNLKTTLNDKTETTYPPLNLAYFYLNYSGISDKNKTALENAFKLLQKIKPEEALGLCPKLFEQQDKLKFQCSPEMQKNAKICLDAFRQNPESVEAPLYTYQLLTEHCPVPLNNADYALLALAAFKENQLETAFTYLRTISPTQLSTLPDSLANEISSYLVRYLPQKLESVKIAKVRCHHSLNAETLASSNHYYLLTQLASSHKPQEALTLQPLLQAFRILSCQLDEATDAALKQTELFEATLQNYIQNHYSNAITSMMKKIAAQSPATRDEILKKYEKTLTQYILQDAQIRIHQNNYDSAWQILDALKNAWIPSEENDKFLFLSAQCLNHQKKFKEAILYLTELQSKYPKSEYAEAALFHSLAISQAHNIKANEILEKFRNLYPTSDYQLYYPQETP